MSLYRVASHRLVGRELGSTVTNDDYTAAEIHFLVTAGLLELVNEDAPKPARRARTKTTNPDKE